MGYRIAYGRTDRKTHGVPLLRKNLTMLFFAVFLILLWAFWPEGKNVLIQCLWPGDADTLQNAAGLFVDCVECGLSFGDSAEIFCREVLSGAKMVR